MVQFNKNFLIQHFERYLIYKITILIRKASIVAKRMVIFKHRSSEQRKSIDQSNGVLLLFSSMNRFGEISPLW